MVLDVVGLPIYEKNYRYAYNKYGSEAYNLVRIKKRTHIAIHHNNLLYCSWVNGMIVPAYLATWSKGTAFCKEIIIEILEVMREEILCIDALISI